jgi:hypothetical protein
VNNLIESRVHPLDAEARVIFPPFRKKKTSTDNFAVQPSCTGVPAVRLNPTDFIAEKSKFARSMSFKLLIGPGHWSVLLSDNFE